MLTYRKGICTCHNKGRLIVKRLPGRKLCEEGNRERLQERRDNSPSSTFTKRRSPLKRLKKPTGEKVLFDAILASRPHVSFVSGRKLDYFDYRNYSCCLHVLSKAKNKYPKFRLYDKNIILAKEEEHRLFDFGSTVQREKYALENVGCDWEKIYLLREELIEEYNQSTDK